MPKLYLKYILLKEKYRMKFIGIGALAVDYYYKDGQFIGRMNGKSFQNIIINLAFLGNKTKIIGTVGSDEVGTFALEMLEKLKIDKEITKLPQNTNRFFIENKKTKKEGKIDTFPYQLDAQKEDIIVIDNINKNKLKCIIKHAGEIVLDLGNVISFLYLEKEEIIKRLKNKFTIINMNERVYKIIEQKLHAKGKELITFLQIKLLIVTYGKKGIYFAMPSIEKMFLITNPYEEVETSGAGDAFFAIILN